MSKKLMNVLFISIFTITLSFVMLGCNDNKDNTVTLTNPIPKELVGRWNSTGEGYYITFAINEDKIYLIAEGEEYSLLARVKDNKIETAELDDPDFKDASIFCTSYTLSDGVLTINANAYNFFSDPDDEYMILSFEKEDN